MLWKRDSSEIELLKYRVEQLEEGKANRWVERVFLWFGATAGTAAIGIIVAHYMGLLGIVGG